MINTRKHFSVHLSFLLVFFVSDPDLHRSQVTEWRDEDQICHPRRLLLERLRLDLLCCCCHTQGHCIGHFFFPQTNFSTELSASTLKGERRFPRAQRHPGGESIPQEGEVGCSTSRGSVILILGRGQCWHSQCPACCLPWLLVTVGQGCEEEDGWGRRQGCTPQSTCEIIHS